MMIYDKSSLIPYTELLGRQKLKFTIRRVNRNWTLDSPLGKMRFGTKTISPRGMSFIKQVGHYVKKNNIAGLYPKKTREELNLKYMMFDYRRRNKIHNKATEIDLSNAYWTTAREMKIISEEIYQKGLDYEKIERLAALGSLAKKVYERKFNGKKYGKAKLISDSRETKHLWYAISDQVDQLMQKGARKAGKKFMFYWVDAIFFENDKTLEKTIQQLFKQHGYDCKTKPIEEVDFQNDRLRVFAKPDKKKPFQKKKAGNRVRQYDPKRKLEFRDFCYSINNEADYWKNWRKKKDKPKTLITSLEDYKKNLKSRQASKERIAEVKRQNKLKLKHI